MIDKGDNVIVYQETKGKLPRLPFVELKNAILGKAYELSVIFIGAKKSQTLNNTYRGKNYPTNILSFPLEKKSGEMYIHEAKARLDTKDFNLPYETFIIKLYIHGLLHLKGLDHGSTMDFEEDRFLQKALRNL